MISTDYKSKGVTAIAIAVRRLYRNTIYEQLTVREDIEWSGNERTIKNRVACHIWSQHTNTSCVSLYVILKRPFSSQLLCRYHLECSQEEAIARLTEMLVLQRLNFTQVTQHTGEIYNTRLLRA